MLLAASSILPVPAAYCQLQQTNRSDITSLSDVKVKWGLLTVTIVSRPRDSDARGPAGDNGSAVCWPGHPCNLEKTVQMVK